jgi:sigma-B regulation protein RsbU (phosphoserine phosphatase)
MRRRDGIWLALADAACPAGLEQAIATETGQAPSRSDDLPDDVGIGIIIADDAHASVLTRAGAAGGQAVQTILLTADPDTSVRADFILPSDVQAAAVMSIIRAAREFRDQVASLRLDVANRKSAVGTITSGRFEFSTLEEARNLSTMLALACPAPDAVVMGLQELLVNAVEHGNLEIGSQLKQELLMQGRWREEIERRLRDPRYAGRRVIVNFSRGRHMISLTIQDEGAGFDHARLDDEAEHATGYRGRGIAMARALSFASVTYLGAGNVVEAIILLSPDAAPETD